MHKDKHQKLLRPLFIFSISYILIFHLQYPKGLYTISAIFSFVYVFAFFYPIYKFLRYVWARMKLSREKNNNGQTKTEIKSTAIIGNCKSCGAPISSLDTKCPYCLRLHKSNK